ncbi:hypothetical protein FSP39_017937 [Pinctada imbricata]|uniref:Elongation of very long chain fatty acids protein n=1 Tax=Pinctada imbricata TaxID=66713 RepID=A0AA88Y1Z8_PINIB|nr:hypothetical protein FSP39_017937 [Pinctada imbricata]
MAITAEKIHTFLATVLTLQSFPIFCVYLVLIALSPVWQRVTNPLKLRPFLIVHNFACSSISVYCLGGFMYLLSQSQSTFEKGSSESFQPYFHMYYITKLIELLDTIFMILRHKQRQISFLHVYHHSSMLLLSDIAYHVYPWPAISVYLAVNSFVHIVLYLYYGLTALFPEKSFPWKQHLTELQILQFMVLFVHATVGYLYHGFCIYGIFYGITMTSLFMNFYYRAYLAPRKGKPHSS